MPSFGLGARVAQKAQLFWIDPFRKRHLVRQLTQKERAWARAEIDPNEVARITFSAAAADPVSTFLAEDPRQELEILAALLLSRKSSLKKPAYALRIPLSPLTDMGIRLRRTPGDTGVGHVDQLHCDLFGEEHAYSLLTSRLRDDLALGGDVVRRIEGDLLRSQLERFRELPEGQLSKRAQTSLSQLLS